MDLTTSGAMLSAKPAHRWEAIAWASSAMRNLEGDIASARQLDCNVMISGEDGVGKKAVAQRLQRQSRRALRPFVVMHASDVLNRTDVIIPALLESAQNGTILFENPHRMALPVQSRLLKCIEHGTVRGRTRPQFVDDYDVRFLTVTSCDLFGLVQIDRFCESLFYRLNPIHLIIPPLRERPEDISILLGHFFSTDRRATTLPRFSAAAWERVVTYPWPGNVRELRAAAATLASRELPRPVEPDDLPTYMGGQYARTDVSDS